MARYIIRTSSISSIHSQQDIFHIRCGWSSGGEVDFTAGSLLKRPKCAEKCVKLIRRHGLTRDGGAPAFVACDNMNRPPRISSAVGVEVSLQPLLISPLSLLGASSQSFSDGVAHFWRLSVNPSIRNFWILSMFLCKISIADAFSFCKGFVIFSIRNA